MIVLGIFGVIVIVATITYKLLTQRKYTPTYISFKRGFELTDLPVVTFYQDTKKFHFLLDTGCSFSSINPKMLPYLTHIETGQTSSYFGVNGETCKAPIIGLELTYKDKTYGGYFQVLTDSRSFDNIKQDHGVLITGLLGSDFLDRYKYVLDFQQMVAYSKT